MKGISFPTLLRLVVDGFRSKKTSFLAFFKKMQMALSTFIKYVFVLLIFSLLLNFIEQQPFFPLFFETASALCTVGLSMGITADLSALGKILITLLMLVGRKGILIIGFAISTKALSWEREKSQDPIF
jgi:trk system potassium uptake protein TrkH